MAYTLTACASAPDLTPHDHDTPPTRSHLIRDVMFNTGRAIPGAARAPLRDLNFMKEDIPLALAAIEYPYRIDGPVYCDQLITEINALNAVLGNSLDVEADQLSRSELAAEAATNAAESALEDAATGWIPYRSAIRRVTGAHQHERETRRAYDRGRIRRAFLKGVGGAFQCPYPARPASVIEPVRESDMPPS